MQMRTRTAAILGSVALVLGLVAGPVVAQEASPAPGAPVAVPFTDSAGVTHGTVTIKSVADPFTDIDPASPPPEGQHFVLATVVFEAADDQSLVADPYQVVLQDSDGYLRWSTWVPRVQPVTVPDLQNQTLAPGDRISGVIGYLVPDRATTAAILYSPEWNRWIPLHQGTAAAPVAIGDPVTVTDASGLTHGTATVRDVADPYTNHDPNQPPAEGMRYVLLTAAFEAAEDQTLNVDPYGITLQDANGMLYNASWVPRPPEDIVPDLQSQLLAPGDRISGRVGFSVPVGAELVAVQWAPESNRFVPLAMLGG
jgi:hypothetical protein